MSEHPPRSPHDQLRNRGTHRGQPDRGQSPSVPTGTRPWCAGPGRPSQHQAKPGGSGRWLRNPLVGIGATAVAGIAISFIFLHRGVPASPSRPSLAAASPNAPQKATKAPIGSYFDVQDGSGDTYQVALVRLIDPAHSANKSDTPNNGKRFVSAVFRIKALPGSPQDENADIAAVLIDGNGRIYTFSISRIAGYANFDNGAIHVAQGQTVTGSVVFQVPRGVQVTEVRWTPGSFRSAVRWVMQR